MSDHDIRAEKQRLRLQAQSRRDAMPEAARIEASLLVADRCAEILHFDAGTIVSGFLPIRSEIDIRPLMTALSDRRARLCVPAITPSGLEFRELVRGAPLEHQGFGTYAPGPDAAVLDPELMLVPLSAFDRHCRRIGYGKGYYDQAIAAIRERGGRPRLVGVCFAVQEVRHAPADEHDATLDMIVTEKEVIRRPG